MKSVLSMNLLELMARRKDYLEHYSNQVADEDKQLNEAAARLAALDSIVNKIASGETERAAERTKQGLEKAALECLQDSNIVAASRQIDDLRCKFIDVLSPEQKTVYLLIERLTDTLETMNHEVNRRYDDY